MKPTAIIPLLPFLLLAANTTTAGERVPVEKPLWEAGIAVGAATLPHYMGSDERYTFAIPVPYIIYRGERLKIGREGITTELFGQRNLSIDASLGIGLPVRNSNRARAGMPDLKFNFQAGPRLNWRFFEDEQFKVTARLPLRGVVDTGGRWLGSVSEPDIAFEYRPNAETLLQLNAGALFASRHYHGTYYSVAPLYATPIRPVYQSRAGLHSLSLSAIARYRLNDSMTLFSAMRYRNLASGVIADSPLVKDQNYISATVGLAWSFWQSEEKGSHSD